MRLLWAITAGCTFVTRAEYEERLRQRDDDGDGFTIAAGDCDDRDPDVYPGRLEAAYDGRDNDCAGDGDLVDIDGDGFAATRAGGDDCRDTDPDVHPDAFDVPYDGVDADCRADNDWDADDDGFMPDDAPADAVGEYKEAWNATFEERRGDCDDFDALVFPAAPGELLYDGVDTNCDGRDDFDGDGDGVPWIPGGGGDCLDLPDRDIDAEPADVFPAFAGRPAASDVPYDGIDADCAGDNDYDVDGDGFVRSGDFFRYRQYEARYGYLFDAGPDDCDDEAARIYPGALEILGDTLDQDCDRRIHGTTFADGGLLWVDPRAPQLVAFDGGFALAVVADELDDGVNRLDHAAVALLFDVPAGPAPAVRQRLTVVGPDATEPLDRGLALLATAGGGFTVGSADARPPGRTLVLLQDVVLDGADYALDAIASRLTSGGGFVVADADVVEVAGTRTLWSCGEDRLQASRGADLRTAIATLCLDVHSCFAAEDGTSATACGTTGCETWTLDAANGTLAPSASQPFATAAWRAVTRRGGLVAAAKVAGGVRLDDGTATVDLFGTVPVVHVDAVADDGEWFVAAVREDSAGRRNLALAWGPAGGTLSVVQLAIFGTRTDLAPEQAAIEVTEDRVMVAVTLRDLDTSGADLVAWAAYERHRDEATPP